MVVMGITIAAYNFDKILSRSNASIFIYKLAVGLYFIILHLISFSTNVRLYFRAKMVTLCIIYIGNRKIFLKHHSPPPNLQPLPLW